MTEAEEIRYLSDLLLQASRWERSEGEVLSGLELEVQDRMRRLTGVNTVDENGLCQSVVERGLTKAAAKNKNKSHSGKNKEGRMRVMYKGHRITVDCDKMMQVPNKVSRTGFKWEPKPGINLDDYLPKVDGNV